MNISRLDILFPKINKSISAQNCNLSKLNYEIKDVVSFNGKKRDKTKIPYGADYSCIKSMDTKKSKTIPELKKSIGRGEDISEDRDKLILSRVKIATEDASEFVSKHPEFDVNDIEQELIKLIIEVTDKDLKSPNDKVLFAMSYAHVRDSYFNKILKQMTTEAEPIGLAPVSSKEYGAQENPYKIAERDDLKEKLNENLKTVTPRQEKILRLYYGLDGEEPKNLREIGKMLGFHHETVRHDLLKALQCFRHPTRTRHIIDYKDSFE